MREDLTGKVFGDLEVQRMSDEMRGGHVMWVCLCLCGRTKSVSGTNLKSGKVRSCGCYRNEASRNCYFKRTGSFAGERGW
jgi:hypothetical protein